MSCFSCITGKKTIKPVIYVKTNPIIETLKKQNESNRNRDTRFRDLYEVEKKNVREYCTQQFETKADPFWYFCYKREAQKIEHKVVNPMIFLAIKEVETRIEECIATQTNLNSLNMLFRLEDRTQLFNPEDYKNIKKYSLLGICQYIKRVILYDMDGLFPNIVSTKLIKACLNNNIREYKRYLSYIPFILSVDEYKLFNRIMSLLRLIAKHEEHTNICIISLLRLFSLSMFNQSSFTCLEVVPITELILNDIVNLDFDKIPISVFGKVLDIEC